MNPNDSRHLGREHHGGEDVTTTSKDISVKDDTPSPSSQSSGGNKGEYAGIVQKKEKLTTEEEEIQQKQENPGVSGYDTEKIPRVSYFSLYRYADRLDMLFIFLGTVGAVVNGAGMPVWAILFGNIINDFGFNEFDMEDLKRKVNNVVPLFIYLGLGTFVGAYCQNFFFSIAAVRQVNKLRGLYLAQVLKQDIAYFDTLGTSGYLLQGLNEDCITFQAAIGEKVGMFLFFMSTSVVGIIVAFVRGWDMTLVILSLLPLLGAAGYGMTVITSRLTSSMNRAYAGANSLAQQALGNIRTVYAYNGEDKALQTYEDSLERPMKIGIKQGFFSASVLGFTNMIAFCCYALAMWYGGERVIDGAYNGGDVMNVLFAALIGGFALGQAVPNVQYFQQGQSSGARLFSILSRKAIIDPEAPGRELEKLEGSLEIEHVSFSYPARPDKPVFLDFSLSVPAGKTVALVGESGSGKSTVIQLVERFYDPLSGRVLLDGVDLRDLNLHWLRSQIGLVSQEPTLFATSIRQNMLLGKPDATDEELEWAAKAANAHKFISSLPEGYDTQVGEKGVQMSGGQKQRIAIARALLKNPRVLLLDEATSALDATSEHVVQEALDRLMQGRTTVVVAHRLSTVVGSDSIAVVKKGRVVEQGTHQELLGMDGVYKTLVQMQGGIGSPERRNTSSTIVEDLEDIILSDDKQIDENGNFEKRDSLVHRTNTNSMVASEAGMIDVNSDGEVKETFPCEAQFSKKDLTEKRQDSSTQPRRNIRNRMGRPGIIKRKPNEKQDGKENESSEENRIEVPVSRLAQLNRPETPALICGLLGSTAMGLIMPMFSLVFSSLVGVFFLTRMFL